MRWPLWPKKSKERRRSPRARVDCLEAVYWDGAGSSRLAGARLRRHDPARRPPRHSAGAWIGRRIYGRLDTERFGRVVLSVLLAGGVGIVLTGLR